MGPIGEELMASSISCPAMDDLGRVIWLTPPHVFWGRARHQDGCSLGQAGSNKAA